MLDRYVQAREVARILGIKTGTLARWRQKGKGPKNWVRMGRTSVAYPLAEVERFLAELAAASASLKKAG